MGEDKNNFNKKIKIYSSNDKMMRELGNILSTPKSRKIYQILIEKQLNAKEIGKLIENDENPRLPNLIYHLDNMVKVGLLSIEKKPQRKRGHVLKYYKAISIILIVPHTKYEKASTSKTLFATLKRVFNLSGLVIGGLVMGKLLSTIPGLENPIITLGQLAHHSFLFLERFFLNRNKGSILIEC